MIVHTIVIGWMLATHADVYEVHLAPNPQAPGVKRFVGRFGFLQATMPLPVYCRVRGGIEVEGMPIQWGEWGEWNRLAIEGDRKVHFVHVGLQHGPPTFPLSFIARVATNVAALTAIRSPREA